MEGSSMQSPTGDPRSKSTRYHLGVRRMQAQREVCGELCFRTATIPVGSRGASGGGLGLVSVSVVSGQEEELDKERKWEQTGTYCFLCVCHHI